MREYATKVEKAIQDIIDIRKAFEKIIEARVQCAQAASSSDSSEDEGIASNVELRCYDQEIAGKLDIIL